jgi:hypothetical protein
MKLEELIFYNHGSSYANVWVWKLSAKEIWQKL